MPGLGGKLPFTERPASGETAPRAVTWFVSNTPQPAYCASPPLCLLRRLDAASLISTCGGKNCINLKLSELHRTLRVEPFAMRRTCLEKLHQGALPRPRGTRWGARQKAAIVTAIRLGALSRTDAHERYMLSEEELSSWEAAFNQSGAAGLHLKSRPRISRR